MQRAQRVAAASSRPSHEKHCTNSSALLLPSVLLAADSCQLIVSMHVVSAMGASTALPLCLSAHFGALYLCITDVRVWCSPRLRVRLLPGSPWKAIGLARGAPASGHRTHSRQT